MYIYVYKDFQLLRKGGRECRTFSWSRHVQSNQVNQLITLKLLKERVGGDKLDIFF